MKVSSCITMINSASLTPWLIQVKNLPDNARVTFLESAIESVPDLRRVKITDNVLQAQLGSTRPISYRSNFDLLKDAAFHLDQATKRGNKT